VVPDPHTNCGPYSPADRNRYEPSSTAGREDSEQMKLSSASAVDEVHHDTVGIVAFDISGNTAGGTSTNGAAFKIPGSVTVVLILKISFFIRKGPCRLSC